MIATATLTKAGQITIPKEIRDFLGLVPGQRISFRKKQDTVLLERQKTVDEITEHIHSLIPEDTRERYIHEYGGLTHAEYLEKWQETPEARAELEEEELKCR